MANHEHLHSAGSSLSYSTDSGSTYTALTDVRKISPAEMDREDSLDSSLDSSNATHEYTPGWRKTGPASCELYLYKALFATLVTAYAANHPTSNYYWKYAVPLLSTESAASTFVWQGFVKTLKHSEASVDSNDKLNVTVTITGSKGVTWTQGS